MRADDVLVLPSRSNGLGLGVEADHRLAIEVGGSDEGSTRSSEAEEGKGHGDGNVDAHLTNIDLVLELASSSSRASEDSSAVTVRVVVDQLEIPNM